MSDIELILAVGLIIISALGACQCVAIHNLKVQVKDLQIYNGW